MDTIIAVLRAAHCKSTHHFFAVDALYAVPSDRGQTLVRLLLANYNDYLKGAKDPDNVFKDFENHVLHVTDGYWGGAAKTAEKWLATSLSLLSSSKWKEAAYAIGVLSHYFTDPFMPLHTAQSPRETIVHRPLEWSVCCAYSEIFNAACNNSQLEYFALQSGSDWIKDGVLRGATMANKFYEPLIDDYDMNESRRNPKLALGTDSKRMLAQLFTWVITGWGEVIERLANESSAQIPEMSLTLPTLVAGIQVPMKKVVAAIESVEQRREVEKILDEYQRTGKVVRNLTLEQVTVKKIRELKPNMRPAPSELPRIVEVPKPTQRIATLATVKSDAPLLNGSKPQFIVSSQSEPKQTNQPVNESPKPSARRSKLTATSPIVDAPAIGPKTAARFNAIGYHTVGDLIDGDPEKISQLLETKWITVRLVAQWQDQALLACKVERMTATGSGLLVLAGIRTAEELTKQTASEIHAKLHVAAQSAEGQRLLRDQPPPPLKTIQGWVDSACSVGHA